MTEMADGQHLKMSQFDTLCDVIMAICYREKGAEFLSVSAMSVCVGGGGGGRGGRACVFKIDLISDNITFSIKNITI